MSSVAEAYLCLRTTWDQVDSWVDILLGDLGAHLPETVTEYLEQNGLQKNEEEVMPIDQLVRWFKDKIESKPSHSDQRKVALTLLFQGRYCWNDDQTRTVVDNPIFAGLALEHAMDHDLPSKPSIWEMTK